MSTYRMADVVPLIAAEAERQGVDPKLAIAHFVAENTSDGVLKPEKQVSLNTQGIGPNGKPSGAVGLFQVVGQTLKGLRDQGYIPANLNYATLEGQVQAGVAAVKESQKVGGGEDVMAGAAQYVDGAAGLRGYRGAGPMPTQTAGYLPKIARSMGMTWSGTAKLPVETKGAVTDNMAVFQSTLDKNLPMLRAMGVEQDGIAANLKGAISEGAAANAAGITAASDREAATVNRDNDLLGVFGLRRDDLVENMTKVSAAEHEMQKMKPTVDALMSMNPLQNPVKWIAAQFQLGSLVPQYNALVQNRDSAAQAIQLRQGLDARQRELTPAITIQQISAEARAKLELNAANAKADLAKVDMQNIAGRTKFLSEELNWAQTGAQMSISNARLMAEQLNLQMHEREEKAKADQLIKINLWRLGLGAPEITTMAQFNALPKDQKDFMINSAGSGTTPGRAITAIKEFGSLPSLQRNRDTAAMGDTVALVVDSIRQKLDPNLPENAGKKENDILEFQVDKQVRAWRDEMKTGNMLNVSSNNPFRMKADIFARAPGLEDNSIAKFVLGEGKNLPQMGEKEILAKAVGQVRAGQDVDKTTQELYDFFSKGTEFQFKSKGMGTLGFDSRTYKGDRSYAIGDNVFGWRDTTFGDKYAAKAPIQMLNPTSVKNFLVAQTVEGIKQEAAAAGLQVIPGNPKRDLYGQQR